MTKKNLVVIVAVILLQLFNLFFYLQLRNFNDFEDTTYSERLIEPAAKNKVYHWTANARVPFTIFNLSGWMMPHHKFGSVILSGEVMYSVPLKINLETMKPGNGGIGVPLEFFGGTFLDHIMIDKYVANPSEPQRNEIGQQNKGIQPNDFLSLRKLTRDLVYWSRLALVFMINASLLLLGFISWKLVTFLERRNIERQLKIKEAYKLKGELTGLMTRLQPEFDRAWLITQNAKLIGPVEKELHRQVYYAIGLVVKDYGEDQILNFYAQAENISMPELDSKVTALSRRADEWVSKQNFQVQQEHASLERFNNAQIEYGKMMESFRKFYELRGSPECGKIYMEVLRTLNAIHLELGHQKVHEKRFAYVRKSLPELEEGLKALRKAQLESEKTATPV